MRSSSFVAGETGHRRSHCPRSRNGCLTCKGRKVRCNERRPRCYHCQRLNLECVWKDTESRRLSPLENGGAVNPPESNIRDLEANKPSASAHFFDFAQPMTHPTEAFPFYQDIYMPDFTGFTSSGHALYERALSTDEDSLRLPLARRQSPQQSTIQSPVANVDGETLLSLDLPPILDPVENGPKRASARELLQNMAASSPMLRCSIAAFEAIQSNSAGEQADYQQYYDKAANGLSEIFQKSEEEMILRNTELKYVLTTIFFLTYINVCLFDTTWIYCLG